MENSYMTLRELKARVSSTKGIKMPSKAKILASGQPIETYSAEGYSISAFQNGFVLAVFDNRYTVVRIDECKDYTYEIGHEGYNGADSATPRKLKEEYFLDKPWTLRVSLEAEDQFQKNGDEREGRWLSEHPEIADDKNWMNGSYYSFEDALLTRMEYEEWLNLLTEKQRRVFVLYYVYGYKQEEIGKCLGVTQNAVCQHLKLAIKKIRKHIDNKT